MPSPRPTPPALGLTQGTGARRRDGGQARAPPGGADRDTQLAQDVETPGPTESDLGEQTPEHIHLDTDTRDTLTETHNGTWVHLNTETWTLRSDLGSRTPPHTQHTHTLTHILRYTYTGSRHRHRAMEIHTQTQIHSHRYTRHSWTHRHSDMDTTSDSNCRDTPGRRYSLAQPSSLDCEPHTAVDKDDQVSTGTWSTYRAPRHQMPLLDVDAKSERAPTDIQICGYSEVGTHAGMDSGTDMQTHLQKQIHPCPFL